MCSKNVPCPLRMGHRGRPEGPSPRTGVAGFVVGPSLLWRPAPASRWGAEAPFPSMQSPQLVCILEALGDPPWAALGLEVTVGPLGRQPHPKSLRSRGAGAPHVGPGTAPGGPSPVCGGGGGLGPRLAVRRFPLMSELGDPAWSVRRGYKQSSSGGLRRAKVRKNWKHPGRGGAGRTAACGPTPAGEGCPRSATLGRGFPPPPPHFTRTQQPRT